MAQKLKVTIEEGESGMWFATCAQRPGLFVSCLHLETLMRVLPDLMRGLVKARELKS